MDKQVSRASLVHHFDFFDPIIGAGKSAVVKLRINYQDMKANKTAKAKFSSPLVGSVNDNIPVSADVHLYADPHTILTETPLLYADCKGLEGGESPPKNELNKMRVRALENMRSVVEKITKYQESSHGHWVTRKSRSESLLSRSCIQKYYTLFQMLLFLSCATPSK